MCTPNLAENLELCSSWIQSPHISVTYLSGQIHFPRDVLAKRSPHFQRIIKEQEQGDGPEDIRLEEVELRTLKAFQRWCMNENPSIPDDIAPSALLDLGIFATNCRIWALIHHVADRFLRKFNDASDENRWTLRADMVARVLRQCDPSSCLRRVMWHKLSSLPPQQLTDEWNEWSELAAGDGAKILLDLLKAMTARAVGFPNARGRNGFRYPTQSIFTDLCQFHDHSQQGFPPLHKQQRFGAFFQQECPFREIECFPDNLVHPENLPSTEDDEAAISPDQALEGEVTVVMDEAMNGVRAEETATFCEDVEIQDTVPVHDDAPVEESAKPSDEPTKLEMPNDANDLAVADSSVPGEDVVIVTSPDVDDDWRFKSPKQLIGRRKRQRRSRRDQIGLVKDKERERLWYGVSSLEAEVRQHNDRANFVLLL